MPFGPKLVSRVPLAFSRATAKLVSARAPPGVSPTAAATTIRPSGWSAMSSIHESPGPAKIRAKPPEPKDASMLPLTL